METAPTVKRRSRMRRESSGKRVELSARDIEIFKLLKRYRYLRSNFLQAFVEAKNETRFKERLGALYHDGRYLNRPQEQWCFANARYAPVIYELDRAGEVVLAQLGLIPKPRKGDQKPGVQKQFAHAVMIAEVLASIELGVRASRNVRFIDRDEILGKAPEAAWSSQHPLALPVSITHSFGRSGKTESISFGLVPDALFGLDYAEVDGGNSYRFFALEAERENRVAASSLRPSSFLKKALAYRDIVAPETYRTQLGIPNLLVLIVTESAARIETMRALVREITDGKGSATLLFRAIAGLGDPLRAGSPAPELFSAPWLRAGHPEFFIDRP